MVVSSAFGLLYSSVRYNMAQHYGVALPSVLEWYKFLTPYAFIFPVLFVVLQAVAGKSSRKKVYLAVLTSSGWLFALTWALLGVLLWQLPYITVVTATL